MHVGLAREQLGDDVTVTVHAADGTAMYSSPEQFNDNPHLTPYTDIYSFGLIMAQVMTGIHPWNYMMRQHKGRDSRKFLFRMSALDKLIPRITYSHSHAQLLAKTSMLQRRHCHHRCNRLRPPLHCLPLLRLSPHRHYRRRPHLHRCHCRHL